jgi:hypothetical protein
LKLIHDAQHNGAYIDTLNEPRKAEDGKLQPYVPLWQWNKIQKVLPTKE